LGLYITGGGSSECNPGNGTIYCTGALSSGQSVTRSFSPSTGASTGAFTTAVEASDQASNASAAIASASTTAAVVNAIDASEAAAAAKLASGEAWARWELNNDALWFGSVAADSCSPAGIAAAGGFWGCAAGWGGACSGNEWVQVGDRNPGANPMTGNAAFGRFGSDILSGVYSCADGAYQGFDIGVAGEGVGGGLGAILGCIGDAAFGGAATKIIQHYVGGG
jgi:hypothetical protein